MESKSDVSHENVGTTNLSCLPAMKICDTILKAAASFVVKSKFYQKFEKICEEIIKI